MKNEILIKRKLTVKRGWENEQRNRNSLWDRAGRVGAKEGIRPWLGGLISLWGD